MFDYYRKYVESKTEADIFKKRASELEAKVKELQEETYKFKMLSDRYSSWDLHSPEGLVKFKEHLTDQQKQLIEKRAQLEAEQSVNKAEVKELKVKLEYEQKLNSTLNKMLEKYLKCSSESKSK